MASCIHSFIQPQESSTHCIPGPVLGARCRVPGAGWGRGSKIGSTDADLLPGACWPHRGHHASRRGKDPDVGTRAASRLGAKAC